MERTEKLLREELRRADAMTPPGRDSMLARVRQARRRRGLGMAGAGTALAAVVAATLLSSSGRPALTPADGLLPRLNTVTLVNVLFTDVTHGYAVQERCSEDNPLLGVPDGAPTPDVHRDCRTMLLATADGGQSWQEKALPGDPAMKDAGVDIVQGHSLMLWRSAPGTVALGGRDGQYWTTSDRGATWQESPNPRPLPGAGALAWFGLHDDLTFLATMPPEGFAADGSKLRIGAKNPVIPASDGSFWLGCLDHPCVQVTRDQGQTWQTSTPDATAVAVDWMATTNGQTVYAAAQTAAGQRLFRSVDGGTMWTDTAVDLLVRTVDGLALPNGDLLIARGGQDGGMLRLPAGSSTPETVAQAPTYTSVLYRTGGVVVAASVWAQSEQPDLDPTAWISADGLSWRPIPAPTD